MLCRYKLAGKQTMMAKVLDFGISHIRRSVSMMTRNTTILGTPQFMAPEMARIGSASLDGRADQFSLAVALYYAWSGRKAFDSDDIIAVLHQVLYEQPEPLARLAPHLPAHVVASVQRAMSKRPEDRFPSISDFVSAIEGLSSESRQLLLPGFGPPPCERAPSAELPLSLLPDIDLADDTEVSQSTSAEHLAETQGLPQSRVEPVQADDDALAALALDAIPDVEEEPAQSEFRGRRTVLLIAGALLLGIAAVSASLVPESAPKPVQEAARSSAAPVHAQTPEAAEVGSPRAVAASPSVLPAVAAAEAPKQSGRRPQKAQLRRAAASLSGAQQSPVSAAPEPPAAVSAPAPAEAGRDAALAAPVRTPEPQVAPVLRAPPAQPAELHAACDEGNDARAQALYVRLPASQRDFARFYCRKQGIALKSVGGGGGDAGAAWLRYGMAACRVRVVLCVQAARRRAAAAALRVLSDGRDEPSRAVVFVD